MTSSSIVQLTDLAFERSDPCLVLADLLLQVNLLGERNLSTTMGHSTRLIREQCPVW